MTPEQQDTANMNDHDLLVTMHEQIKGIKNDIKDIKDGTSQKLADHEERIRKIETNITKIMTWGTALIVVLGIVEFIISNFFKCSINVC